MVAQGVLWGVRDRSVRIIVRAVIGGSFAERSLQLKFCASFLPCGPLCWCVMAQGVLWGVRDKSSEELQRRIRMPYFMGRFQQKSPMISGSVAERDLQLCYASWTSL